MISLLIGLCLASGENADIEILPVSISPNSIPGIDSTTINDFGHLYLTVQTQYIRDPLVLYADNADRGSIVGQKQSLNLGAAFDFSKLVSVHLRIPVAMQWGSENPSLTRTGLGFGDANAGVRVKVYQNRSIRTAAKVDFYLPTGSKNAWLSELQVRGSLGGLFQADWKNFEALGELSMHFREPVNTDKDFVLSNELVSNLGLRWNLWPENFALGTLVLMRSGLNNFLRGGAESSAELINFVQLKYNDDINWEVGLGKGLSQGYGTSEIRVFASARYHRKGEKPKPVFETDPPPFEPEPIIEIPQQEPPPDEPVFEEEELAKVQDDQIYIRDAIQFKVGTDTILLESKPTLEFVANIINEDIKIGHLVIEGHASEEGSFDYNYDLSNLRARAIYRALTAAGVHPDRMSYRGYGEALPKVEGSDEASLAQNRRVEFHIVRQDPASGPLPELRDVKTKPWDGTPLRSIIPELKEIPKEKKKPEGFQFEEEEDFMFE
ncbi:MAG: OmpA family protein, partial [Myxococcota bacterium]|nr:OmpA family protein [Myxococcota bacterium]